MTVMPTIFVNGRFIGRPVTGVERFATLVLKEIVARARTESALRWTVLAPTGVERPEWLGPLPFRTVGRLSGHPWEQTELFWASRNGTLVNLCNSGPVLHGRQLTVIHDALVYRHPENFSRRYGTVHRQLGRLLARRARLATVSEFSRRELSALLGVPAGSIAVIPNAVDHMAEIEPDVSVLDRFGLQGKRFLLAVGSPAPNKNLARAVRAFLALDRDDISFVLVGKAAAAFARSDVGTTHPNVVATGRLSDGEVQALYRSAVALVFPSIYEGFGIPPLEAMTAGCPVLAADIPPVREVCADAALYFDPLDEASMADAMRRCANPAFDGAALREAGYLRTRAFSWEDSARRLLDALRPLEAASLSPEHAGGR
ncbi:glycosyltransferase family 4 protein [Xanthobacter versatilis]|uniref:glycosyltransferase family 4 protein n=1 Tax=Xanthobacter autotrophicus (strain ATCC BAA-1158 / Py2) TaxID=78245 RepID=UPI003727F13C